MSIRGGDKNKMKSVHFHSPSSGPQFARRAGLKPEGLLKAWGGPNEPIGSGCPRAALGVAGQCEMISTVAPVPAAMANLP